MTDPRQRVVQQPPGAHADLRGFPQRVLAAGAAWWRQHRATASPWWFSASGAGRFDLPRPQGTCYLASSAPAAVRERLGPDLVAHGLVPASLLAGRVVSRLALPGPVSAANLDATAAMRFGVSRELAVIVPYAVPQAWARSLAAAGFGGIAARLRFTPGRALGLALFGVAGEGAEWSGDADPVSAIAVARRLGLRAVAAPLLSEVTVLRTPLDPPR